MKRQLANGGIARQMLLVPAVVELDPDDAARLAARAEVLAAFGLVLEGFGPGAVMVREVPALIGDADIVKLVRDLADHLAEWDDALPLGTAPRSTSPPPWPATARCAPAAASSRRR